MGDVKTALPWDGSNMGDVKPYILEPISEKDFTFLLTDGSKGLITKLTSTVFVVADELKGVFGLDKIGRLICTFNGKDAIIHRFCEEQNLSEADPSDQCIREEAKKAFAFRWIVGLIQSYEKNIIVRRYKSGVVRVISQIDREFGFQKASHHGSMVPDSVMGKWFDGDFESVVSSLLKGFNFISLRNALSEVISRVDPELSPWASLICERAGPYLPKEKEIKIGKITLPPSPGRLPTVSFGNDRSCKRFIPPFAVKQPDASPLRPRLPKPAPDDEGDEGGIFEGSRVGSAILLTVAPTIIDKESIGEELDMRKRHLEEYATEENAPFVPKTPPGGVSVALPKFLFESHNPKETHCVVEADFSIIRESVSTHDYDTESLASSCTNSILGISALPSLPSSESSKNTPQRVSPGRLKELSMVRMIYSNGFCGGDEMGSQRCGAFGANLYGNGCIKSSIECRKLMTLLLTKAVEDHCENFYSLLQGSIREMDEGSVYFLQIVNMEPIIPLPPADREKIPYMPRDRLKMNCLKPNRSPLFCNGWERCERFRAKSLKMKKRYNAGIAHKLRDEDLYKLRLPEP